MNRCLARNLDPHGLETVCRPLGSPWARQGQGKGANTILFKSITRMKLLFSNYYQARNKSTKINFLDPETARWGGGLPREGVVAENFVPALESLSSLGFEERNLGCPGNFAGMSRPPGGVQKVCAKKLRVHFSFPI